MKRLLIPAVALLGAITVTAGAPASRTSLSERVDFVGRFKDGYRVWQVVH